MNRKGIVQIADVLIENGTGLRIIQKFYNSILPIQVTHNVKHQTYDIVGISYGDEFQILLKGETVPTYKVWFDDIKDEIWFERQEVEDEEFQIYDV